MSTYDLCLEQKYEKKKQKKKKTEFLSKSFNLLVVKFSDYLNRHVFVMLLKRNQASWILRHFQIKNIQQMFASSVFAQTFNS